ncbi:MAG: hypothetical protein HOP31_12885, partial [Ignavibacteria bacterium]|nr:hypothetical protein [Ignavibacteria bacterium]
MSLHFLNSKFTHLQPIEKLKTEKFYLELEIPYFENNHPTRNIKPLKKRLAHVIELIQIIEEDKRKNTNTFKSIPEKIQYIQNRLQHLKNMNTPLNNPIIEIFETEIEIYNLNY